MGAAASVNDEDTTRKIVRESIENASDADLGDAMSELLASDPERFERLVRDARERRATTRVSQKRKHSSDDATTNVHRLIIEEMNLARCAPLEYARKLESIRVQFDGKQRRIPGRDAILLTAEGVDAVNECIAELKRQHPIPPISMEVSEGMCNAARDHVRDTGPKGMTGHDGSDGSSPFDRMDRYGQYKIAAAENISYGYDNAEDIVMQLMIDDNVKNRGHRKNILNEKFAKCGIALGPHATFEKMCVIVYAGGYGKKLTQSGHVECTGAISKEMKDALDLIPVAEFTKTVRDAFEGPDSDVTVSLQFTPHSATLRVKKGRAISTMKAGW